MKNPDSNKSIRLHVFLSRCGLGSRRKCEEIVGSKRVSVNGVVVSSQGYKINENDVVLLDHNRIQPLQNKIYIALNKPQKYLCSNSDNFGRPLASDLLQDIIHTRVFHVGRLDYMSSGLILYTNDGEFAHRVVHPAFEVEKEYIVVAKNKISEEILEEFRRGISIENASYKLNHYHFITPHKVKLRLNEGKNREIRKVLEHFRIDIRRIHRIRIGIISIKGLSRGQFRVLTKKEIRWFFEKCRMV